MNEKPRFIAGVLFAISVLRVATEMGSFHSRASICTRRTVPKALRLLVRQPVLFNIRLGLSVGVKLHRRRTSAREALTLETFFRNREKQLSVLVNHFELFREFHLSLRYRDRPPLSLQRRDSRIGR